jgi:diguanylate cyclase (GGDEF)-like protein
MDEIKKSFLESIKEINTRRLKTLLLLGALIVYPGFWLLDILVVPNNLIMFFLKIRLLVVISAIFTYLLLALPATKNFSKRYVNYFIFYFACTAGGGIAVMIRYFGGYASTYYAGIILVMLCFAVSFVLNPSLITMIFVSNSLMYILPSILIDKPSDLRPFISNSFFLVSVAFFSTIFSILNYYQQYRVFLLSHNIEEQNKKLKELDEVKSKFFSNITHELRTPLTLITTPLENILYGNEQLPENLKPQLEIMYNNSLRLIKLINTVLDLSKIEAKAMKLVLHKDNFAGFIEYLTGAFDSMVKQKNILIAYENISNIDEFVFDKEKIENIFVNLAFNAIKFTPQGGNIKVQTGTKENYAFFSVKDTGIGIKKEKIPLIFDRFTQIDDSHKKEYSGTGIGLAIVKEFVELHHGNIVVESEEGKGSKFTIYIPMNLEETNETVSINSEDITKKIAKKAMYTENVGIKKELENQIITESPKLANILAVDDNQDMLSVINETLKNSYNIKCLNNSVEVLKIVADTHPDIIISDLMMPQIDGLELCQMLKKDPRTKRIPFILLTAKADLADRIKGLELGVDDYLFKPFHPAELKARIKAMLRLKQLSDELNGKKEKLEELNLTLQDLAIKDPLTGIYNRRYFFSLLGQAIEEKKYTNLGLIILDIDYFKKYNDTNGHMAGDSALRKVTETIQSKIQNSGKLFRYGGEEFAIILPDKNKTETLNISEIIRKSVENEKFHGEEILPNKRLTISLGSGTYPENGETIDKLIANIDNALYKAKENRNTVCSA